jgi:hypothetical protein
MNLRDDSRGRFLAEILSLQSHIKIAVARTCFKIERGRDARDFASQAKSERMRCRNASLTTSYAAFDRKTRVPSGCGENRLLAASGLLDNPQRGCPRRPSLQSDGFWPQRGSRQFEAGSK